MSVINSYAQDFNNAIQLLKSYKLDDLEKLQPTLKLNQSEFDYLNNQKQLIINGTTDSLIDFKIDSSSIKNSTLKLILLGDYYLFKNIPEDSLAYSYYSKAVNTALKTKDTILITESCKKIFKQLFKTRHSLDGYPIYLDIYKDYLYDANEKATYSFHLYNYEGSEHRLEKIASLKLVLSAIKDKDLSFLKAKINQLIGVEFDYFKKNSDSSLVYYLKAKELMQEKPYQFYRNELFGINANIGLIYLRKEDYENAKKYFQFSNSINLPKYRFVEKVKINELLADIELQSNNWENAYSYLKSRNAYSDTLNEYSKATKITEINTKYETEKKEKEILQLSNDNLKSEAKRKQNQNIALGLAGSLALGSIIAFLIFKNTKRKQKLAEQDKELETQKLATVLKEQELTTIDAMIEGQEKERQRIANDLHDDLGGLMATVKLHFNALKEKQTPELYAKTNQLIDEAYEKVRSVAHAKNSGVIAKQGLLKAVQQMADKVSVLNKIKINVIDHGLDERLENSLELTIFRIIQELITNIIKHANATEANIHITNHEDTLNIMVEDNGKGFNASQITKTKKGMGISSIDKRVAHLDGTLTIESEHNQGTTIIIDIPI
ncbi:sensor histidine kinase [Psychroserpens sp.]|uniref:sensor histidine kinase n=1 Tax=Psychroserpens sp. TaxID=2020870 RepID=UPI002B26B270|nr:sensor histidine kinase [Psychroserpens sp.]